MSLDDTPGVELLSAEEIDFRIQSLERHVAFLKGGNTNSPKLKIHTERKLEELQTVLQAYQTALEADPFDYI